MRAFLVKDGEEREFLGFCKDVWDKSFSEIMQRWGIEYPYLRIEELAEEYYVDFGSYSEFIEVIKK